MEEEVVYEKDGSGADSLEHGGEVYHIVYD